MTDLELFIDRPSLIWTWSRPQALLSVIPFYLANKAGISFVDRPVTLESLVKAMIVAVDDRSVSGIQRYMDIEATNKAAAE